MNDRPLGSKVAVIAWKWVGEKLKFFIDTEKKVNTIYIDLQNILSYIDQ